MAKNIKAAKAASGRKTIKAASGKKKRLLRSPLPPSVPEAPAADIIDRLWTTVMGRRNADPSISHSARLLSRGTAKVAQKFGEEAVECLIEAVAKNPEAVVAESADVLYHLVVLWVAAGVEPGEVWSELHRRQGLSGLAEKASRLLRTTKIP
ncbi:MAG: phosphoribosyl-ATP diphosphatase [Acetobacteraceae bacterium]|nr:phosphoribosyl-ATP diphosphatase [Acetobacteraceae bacterium]